MSDEKGHPMSEGTRETIPITSPLAVLTTRTTQEHIMNTHSPADLKPGDIVKHAERGLNGLAVHGDGEETRVLHLTSLGIVTTTSDLDGWERIEAIRPGHVQVRVDDLEPGLSAGDDEAIRRLYLAWRKMPADEKPTSATVTLYCPGCGEAVHVTVVMLGRQSSGKRWLGLRDSYVHTCPPAQPDEPTEFGARVAVTLPDGTREKWCRLGKHHSAPWLGETYDVPGEEWGLLCQRGTVTLGWDE